MTAARRRVPPAARGRAALPPCGPVQAGQPAPGGAVYGTRVWTSSSSQACRGGLAVASAAARRVDGIAWRRGSVSPAGERRRMIRARGRRLAWHATRPISNICCGAPGSAPARRNWPRSRASPRSRRSPTCSTSRTSPTTSIRRLDGPTTSASAPSAAPSRPTPASRTRASAGCSAWCTRSGRSRRRWRSSGTTTSPPPTARWPAGSAGCRAPR